MYLFFPEQSVSIRIAESFGEYTVRERMTLLWERMIGPKAAYERHVQLIPVQKAFSLGSATDIAELAAGRVRIA